MVIVFSLKEFCGYLNLQNSDYLGVHWCQEKAAVGTNSFKMCYAVMRYANVLCGYAEK